MVDCAVVKRLLPALVWSSAFALYALTAGPSIVALFDDTLEFQLAAPTFRIAHPTGYPLYILLGGLWTSLLPIGNWAWRMNLFSALCAAATVMLLFLLTRRLCTRRNGMPNQWSGIAAAVAFGLGPIWWRQATVAEVYALHLLLMAAIFSTAIGMNTVVGTARFDRRMGILLLLIGLGLAHHRTTVLILPGLVLYLLWSVPDLWRPRPVWFLWLVALLAPLLLYAGIPLRAAMGANDLNGSYVNTWRGFLDHILARQYTSFFVDNTLAVERTAQDWAMVFVGQFGVLPLGIATAGLARVADREHRPVKAWIFVLVVLLTNGLFALTYHVGDVEVFLLPVFFCVALLVGAGLSLPDFFISNKTVVRVVEGLLVVVVALGVWGRGAVVNRSNDWKVHNYAVAMAKIDFPQDSAVVGLEGETTALLYMQAAEGLGLNAQPIAADDPSQRASTIRALMSAGRPVFLTREVEGIASEYSFTGVGPLVRVWPRGRARTESPQTIVEAAIGDGDLLLEGYDLLLAQEAGEPALRLTLFWRVRTPLNETIKVSLRLLDDKGDVISAAGTPLIVDAFPLRQVSLSTDWYPNERIADVYTLPAPAQTLTQAKRLDIIVYDADTVAELGRVTVDLEPFIAAADAAK